MMNQPPLEIEGWKNGATDRQAVHGGFNDFFFFLSYFPPFARTLCILEMLTLGFGIQKILNHIVLSVDFYLAHFPDTKFSFIYVLICFKKKKKKSF